jgi:hypothetical protein
MGVDGRTTALVTVLLVAAGGLGVGVGVLTGGRDGTAGRSVGLTATEDPPGPTASPSRRAAPRIPAPLPTGRAVPVYVLGASGLYREFRAGTATSAADPVGAAVAALAAAPADPDYRTAWAGVTARVARAGAVATVTFAGPPALGGQSAALAVQQVVWTVTAADPAVTRVRVVAPGLPAAPAAGRAGQAGVLAPVWLLNPVDRGAAGAAMLVSGTASVVEATVAVEVRRGAAVVARTTATASVGAPGRGAWSARVSVPPGEYVVAAYEVSAKDGSPVGVDTKRVTVSGR